SPEIAGRHGLNFPPLAVLEIERTEARQEVMSEHPVCDGGAVARPGVKQEMPAGGEIGAVAVDRGEAGDRGDHPGIRLERIERSIERWPMIREEDPALRRRRGYPGKPGALTRLVERWHGADLLGEEHDGDQDEDASG